VSQNETLFHHQKDQLAEAVRGNDGYILWKPHRTQKNTLQTNCRHLTWKHHRRVFKNHKEFGLRWHITFALINTLNISIGPQTYNNNSNNNNNKGQGYMFRLQKDGHKKAW